MCILSSFNSTTFFFKTTTRQPTKPLGAPEHHQSCLQTKVCTHVTPVKFDKCASRMTGLLVDKAKNVSKKYDTILTWQHETRSLLKWPLVSSTISFSKSLLKSTNYQSLQWGYATFKVKPDLISKKEKYFMIHNIIIVTCINV